MAGKLITLPLRASLRSAQLMTRAADGAARRVLSIIGHANARHDEPVARPVSPTDVERRTAPLSPAATPPAASAPVVEAPPPVFEEPAHVSEEPVLVRESAEPGAEEGAGARITVIEPWTGYGRMNATDVIDRVRTASVAELAALRLYEARHRARRTVLAAVDRQLKLAAGGRPA
jgi:hypothetical protein